MRIAIINPSCFTLPCELFLCKDLQEKRLERAKQFSLQEATEAIAKVHREEAKSG